MNETVIQSLQRESQNADQLAYEINFIKRQTYEYVLKSSVDIGEKLSAAKELVPHGQWTDWLAEKVDYSQSTANNFMRIYREYSDNQISLSGRTNSETFANLNYSQAVALFALPMPQREEFVETHDVPEMSVKELKEAIAAQKAAEEAKEKAERERDKSEERVREALKEIDEAHIREGDAYKELRSLKDNQQKLNISVYKATKEAEKAKAEAERLQKELDEANRKMQELTSAPAEISDEERAEIEEAIARKFEDRLSQLTLDAETERKRAEAIATEKAALEAKAAQQVSNEMIKLNTLFEQEQKNLISIKQMIDSFPEQRREKLCQLFKVTLSNIFGGV